MDSFNRNQAWPSTGGVSELPVQAIPTKRKTKEWFRSTMDALEVIGLRQMSENQRYRDFYRMKDGKLSFMELKNVIPYLRDVQQLRDGLKIPSFLRHYDLLGTIVNAFIGWLDNMSDKYNVVGLDETEVNEYTETKEFLLHNYISEALDKRIRMALAEKGLERGTAGLHAADPGGAASHDPAGYREIYEYEVEDGGRYVGWSYAGER